MSSTTTKQKNASSRQDRRGGNRQGRGRGGKGKQRSQQQQGGGARSGGVHFSRMPRRKPKPSFWERLLGMLGLGGKKKTKTAKKQDGGKGTAPPAKGRVRTTVAKGKNSGQAAAKKAKRTPERVEVTSSRLYVGNLSYDATESDLVELFNGVGMVANAEIVYHTRTQRSKGYGFVEMQSIDEAHRAVDELHDKEYMGRKMVVSGAKKPRNQASD